MIKHPRKENNIFSDNDIIDKADEWKEKQFQLKEEDMKLRHKRLCSIGKFLKHSIVVLAACVAIAGGGFGIKFACDANAESDKIEQANWNVYRQQQANIKKAYERAWVACVEKLSLEECDLIRTTNHNKGFEAGQEDYKHNR